MKRPLLYLLLVSVIGMMGLASCGEDRWPAYYEYTGDNLWIDSVMRNNYLWVDDMPKSKELSSNYFATNEAFLKAVKSSNDSQSSIDSLDMDGSYGMNVEMYSLSSIDAYVALVTYVEPNGPADLSGLDRGDWILAIEGTLITESSLNSLLADGGSYELTVATYQVIADEEGNEGGYLVPKETVTLQNATLFTMADVPYYQVLDINGSKIGYMVCNSMHDSSVDLIEAAGDLAGVTEMVLDLRYNNYGELGGMQMLASLLAPSSVLGSTLATMTYNSKSHPDWPTTLTLDAGVLQGAKNLNLSRVYVLTSSTTQGMAEHLINCLKPYMEVILIGGKTAGQTYGLTAYDNTYYGLCLNLVTSEVLNSEGTADFSSGFSVDQSVSDLGDPATILPLGNPSETLLAAALALISGE